MQADVNNILDMIKTLQGISEPCERGVQRRSFTEEYGKGIEYVKGLMEKEGLRVREDSVGNLFATLPGEGDPSLPGIWSGSHLDTVKCAGAYDGIAGVACALEVARMIIRSGQPLKHPFTVFGTMEEEGTRFGQVCLGSKYMAGVFGPDQLDEFRDPETGESFRKILSDYHHYRGNDETGQGIPDGRMLSPGLQDQAVKAIVEVHGEQGSILEQTPCQIGVVDCVAGILWMEVTVHGVAGHSGTVPMHLRKDAGIGADRMILHLNDFVTDNYPGKATLTAGRLVLDPGSSNCIPGKCTFTLDIRSGKGDILARIAREVDQAALQAEERGFSVDIKILSQRDPIYFNEDIRTIIGESADGRALTRMNIDSGAGHDSMVFAQEWPTGMIFLPNRDGISHNPAEYISPEALKEGAEVLYDTIRKIDRMADES